MILLFALLANARAGYGDVDPEGYPAWGDRILHLWTNAARVDPEAFEDDYNAGGCSYYEQFSEDEQTPKAPIFYDRSLNEAAVYHTKDMHDSGNFSHDSSDGTSFGDRLADFYPESAYIGENIAYGYGSEYNAVFVGWMCSESGHRANIMSGDWTELGTGSVSDYYTQDFGAGPAETESAVAMGVHAPESPSSEVEFWSDWVDGSGPAKLNVVLDGQATALNLVFGAAEAGVYQVSMDVPDGDCHQYFFDWQRQDGSAGTFPEDGSYLFGGDCAALDGEELGWMEEQMGISGEDDLSLDGLRQSIKLVGCASAPGPASLAGLALAGLAALGRRRR